ncbi:MAG: VaFE repeat-containing surface-anchored protein [Eubacteriales bacterium]|nr:VaFE repeat-containing surface-anchored protein [Eubacteriales bacterium]
MGTAGTSEASGTDQTASGTEQAPSGKTESAGVGGQGPDTGDAKDYSEDPAGTPTQSKDSEQEETKTGETGGAETVPTEQTKENQTLNKSGEEENDAGPEEASTAGSGPEKGAEESVSGEDGSGPAGETGDADGSQKTDSGLKTEPASGEAASAEENTAGAEAAQGAQNEQAAQAGTGEEEWMTLQESGRAFRSATLGLRKTAASTLSNAVVVSKGEELDYEELGFGTDGNGHIGHTTLIGIRDEDSNRYTGVCVVPDDRGWPKGTTLPGVTRVTDAVLIRLYYYTLLDDYGENLARSMGFDDISREASQAACHEAMAKRYSELAGVEYDRPNVNGTLRGLVNAYTSAVASLQTPDPDKVIVYLSARTRLDGHWRQAYIFGRIEEEDSANVVLVKTSSDPDMRAGYSAYSLHETAGGSPVNFRLYTDQSCTVQAQVYADEERTQLLDPIPVGLTSKSGLNNRTVFYCEPGTYYLKELNAPKGYQQAESAFGPYTLEEGVGKTIRIPNTPLYAKAGVQKVDSRTGEPVSGAKFAFYSEYEDARNEETPEAVLTTGSDGKTATVNVLAGKSYYVRETAAPEGYKEDRSIRKLEAADSVDQVRWTRISNVPKEGKVRVVKTSADPEADRSPYSLAGAVYTLYDKTGGAAGTLKTGADGKTDVLTVRIGKYTLRETTASPGFLLDPRTYEVEVRENETSSVDSVEKPRMGKITVHKYSSEEKAGKEPDTMPIAGAIYSLYKTEKDAKEGQAAVGSFVIKEDGSANIIEVLAGRTWYVKETKTPEGYLPDEKIHAVEVKNFTDLERAESEDRLIFGGVRIAKLDRETGKGKALGGATLEGAVFRVFNEGNLSVYADGKKVLPGQEALTLETDADGFIQTGPHALSYGSYRIEEITPPEGYTILGAGPVRFRIREDGVIVDLAQSKETSIQNAVMRGDFSLRKLNGYSQKRMAGVTFEISGLDRSGKVIEKHRFTTDKNGSYESTAAWYANFIGAQKSDPKETQETAGGQDSGEGRLWFGIGTEAQDSLGALPYGDYHIEEIEGENNRGMKMFSEDFSVYADRQTISLGNIENTLRPVLETELVDEDGDHFAGGDGIVTLTDTVVYGGMEEYTGKEVTFRGVIYVKETGEPLKIGGRTVESVRVKKILSPSGTVQLRFTFDASEAQGRTLVCYEYAYEGDVTGALNSPVPGEIASHADPDDEAQTVRLVRIETDARDQLSGMHIGEAREGAVTVDHVTCDGLIPGRKYLVTGTLVDKSTGRPLKGKDGTEVTAGASFTAENVKQTVDLTFTYDATLLEGTTVVAFERLYLQGGEEPDNPDEPGEPDNPDQPDNPDNPDQPENPDNPDDPDNPDQPENPDEPEKPEGPPIAVHEDPDDEDQSVHYPQVRTSAEGVDKNTEETTKSILAEDQLTVRDHVTWKNLLPGRTYRLQGTLMRKDSGKPLEAGEKAVEGTASFTPSSADGETDLEFHFDAAALFDKEKEESLQVVAFEELYVRIGDGGSGDQPAGGNTETEKAESDQTGNTGEGSENEILVASHRDLQDIAQTVVLRKPGSPEEPIEPEKPKEPEKPENPEEPDHPDAQERARRQPVADGIRQTGRTCKAGRIRKDREVSHIRQGGEEFLRKNDGQTCVSGDDPHSIRCEDR